jgi:hypothetical protein
MKQALISYLYMVLPNNLQLRKKITEKTKCLNKIKL